MGLTKLSRNLIKVIFGQLIRSSCYFVAGWQTISPQNMAYKEKMHQIRVNLVDILEIDIKKRYLKVLSLLYKCKKFFLHIRFKIYKCTFVLTS